MGHLEDLGRRRTDRHGDITFSVGGQERIHVAVRGEKDDCVVVRVVGRKRGFRGPKDPERGGLRR